VELLKTLPRLNPRILGKIHREIFVAHDAVGAHVDAVAVPGNQLLKCLHVARLGPLDQLRLFGRGICWFFRHLK